MQRKREQKGAEKGDKELEEAKKLEVCDYLVQNERRIHSRHTEIQCKKKNFLKVL